MASNPSTSHLDCQNECREIHEKKSQLGHLARILARRTQLERQQLCSTYTAMYGQDLVEHLQRAQAAGQRNEICTLLSLWMLSPHERDVVLAKQSLEIGDNQYIALVEIYVGRKPRQMLLMKQTYLARFKRHLDYDIASSEPKSPYQKILAALDAAHKSHDMDVSLHVAQWDAKRLYEAVEGRAEATDEAVVIEILSKRCLPQLKLMLSCYKHIYGHDLTKTLKKKTQGEFEDSFLMTVKCMYTPAKYYAKMLYKSIKGLTTDKNILPRALMNVIETDRKEVEKAFQTKYGMKIHEAIQGSMPDGDYKEFLLALATPSIR
ncbi:uncharacterized protein LOC116246118 [Nymphaea colorata]|nr:uncharacterized protein LOC116246118 [Nymphaea colorata]